MSGPAWASTSALTAARHGSRRVAPPSLLPRRLYHGSGQAKAPVTFLSRQFYPSSSLTKGKGKQSDDLSHDDAAPTGSAVDAFNHLLDGNYIRSSSSGIFSFLPLGLHLLNSIETVIDREMASIDASRMEMPTVLPAKLWKTSGRWEAMRSELFTLQDRKGSDFLLAPTHEEEITKVVCSHVQSFKHLPVRVYQVTKKFRDEPRPRLGLLRTREFRMKDLYSFDASTEDAVQSYNAVRGAYQRVLDNLVGQGNWKTVEADMGAMGGRHSHEYHVEDGSGEDDLLSCSSCSYAANAETAVVKPGVSELPSTSDDLRVHLYSDVSPQHDTGNSNELVAVVSVSNQELNDVKLKRHMPADAQRIDGVWQWDWRERPEGPLSRFQRLKIVADQSCTSIEPEDLEDKVSQTLLQLAAEGEGAGSSETPLPSLSDFFSDAVRLDFHDLRTATEGTHCPACSDGHLRSSKAIEVGHVFLLGTRYTSALGYQFATRPTEEGKQGRAFVEMGCYGLGVTRLLGVIALNARKAFLAASQANQGQDRPGLLWPEHLAPYTHAIVLDTNVAVDHPEVQSVVEQCGPQARILIDDRTGSKYKGLGMGARLRDVDLIGAPHVWTVRAGQRETEGVTVQKIR